MTTRKRIFLVLFTLLSFMAFDQATKAMARSYLPRGHALSFAGDTVRLDFTVNRGAVFNFEYLLPEKWRGPASTLAVAAGLTGLLLWAFLSSTLTHPAVIGLSLFCGGSLSNLLDRVALGGSAVDFLNFGWGYYRSSIFNVADVGIAGGAALFVLSFAWRLGRSAARP